MQKCAGLGTFDEFFKSELDLHFTMAESAGNPLFVHFLTLIRDLMAEWMYSTARRPGVAEESVIQRRSIHEAIRYHSQDRAMVAVRQHVDAMADK